MAVISRARTAAGTRLFIADGLPNTYDQGGYDALSWLEVGEVTELSEFGKEYNIINHNLLADRKTFKHKGSYDEGNITITYGVALGAEGDLGQDLLLEALDSDNSFAFKIELNDDPDDGANSAPTTKYFPAKVSSARINPGSVDAIVTGTSILAIDGEILSVQAKEHA